MIDKMSETTKQSIMNQLEKDLDKIDALRQIAVAERFNIKYYYIKTQKGNFVINNNNIVGLITK